MNTVSKTEKPALTISVFLLFSFIIFLLFVHGCASEDDDDDNNDDGSFTSGPCSSILEVEGLNLDEFEVYNTEDCATAGVIIEIDSFNYSEDRTIFTGTGTYSSENSPHYILSRDQNNNLCYIELEQGEFRFSVSRDWCTEGFGIYVYSSPPLDGSLDDAVCAFNIITTAEGLEDCELGP